MATFVAASASQQQDPGAGASGVSPATPAGTASGDTIFFLIEMATAQKGTVVALHGQTQVGTWVDGAADSFNAPSISVWKATHDGVRTNWGFDFTKDASRGMTISTVSYSGDCTVQQVLTEFDASVAGARSGPAMNAATGNRIVAFHGGTAAGATTTWNNSFVERTDYEYYGLVTIADIAGDGTVKTPNLTPSVTGQSMWLVVNLGPTSAVTLDSCLPDADVVTTGWTTAPLFSKVNDASDATVIQATAV